METVEIKGFARTIGEEELMRKAKNNPLIYFKQWPLREVRKACVKEIKKNSSYHRYRISQDLAEWLEECIPALLEQNDRFGEEFLEWYICEGTKDEDAVRAIEFGIKLKNKISVTYNLSKFIAGRLLKSGDIMLYSQIPSLRSYLLELLSDLAKQKGKRDGVLGSYWICAERAMKIIIAAGDFSFLPQIEELITLYQTGILNPWRFSAPYEKGMNLAMLKETRRLLNRAQRESLAKKKE